MFTIKEAAERAKLSPDLLRAWERRYGVVSPTRSASGYRLYSATDIERLARMRRLVAGGYRPLEAALHLDTHDPGPASRAVDGGGGAATVKTHATEATPGADRALVDAAAALDPAALREFFDGLGALGSFEAAVTARLFPALRALGEAWADGTVSVAGEHMAAAAALRWLGLQYEAAARDSPRPRVLVGLPPGSHHELGALAHAVALRRHGLDVLYLGKNLPVEDWITATSNTGARLVLVGVALEADVIPASRVAGALRAAVTATSVSFGGAAAGAERLRAFGDELPADFALAAAKVDEILGGGQ